MLLVTNYRHEAEKFYYAEEGKAEAAFLAILKQAWKKYFAKWDLTVDPQALRYHFTQEHWEMATMDDALFEQLPEGMKKLAAGHRNRYRIGMERLNRKVEMLNAAKTLIKAPKEEALKMTTTVNGKKRPLVVVVAEELNEFLKDATNDGYTSTELYTIHKTEKF